jgi:hypothetical protein
MGRAKKRPLFEGELATPIIVPFNDLVLLAMLERALGRPLRTGEFDEFRIKQISELKTAKLRLLIEHLGVKIDEPDVWVRAFLALAEKTCPGLEAISGAEALSRRRGRPLGRRAARGDERSWGELLNAVDVRPKGESIMAACVRLSKDRNSAWHAVGPRSLRTRYYEERKKSRDWRALVEGMLGPSQPQH